MRMQRAVQSEQMLFCADGCRVALARLLTAMLLISTLFGNAEWGKSGLAEEESIDEDGVWAGDSSVFDLLAQPDTTVPDDLMDEPVVQNEEDEKSGVDSVFIGEYDVLNDNTDGPVPMEWYVLGYNDEYVKLLSRYAVAEKRMNRIPETDAHNTELMQWLQNEFLNQAFQNDEEKEAIRYIGLYGANFWNVKFNLNVIEEHPEIMLLEQTEDFQQDKWWMESYPMAWLPLATEGGSLPESVIPESIWPAYEKLIAGKQRKDGAGIGYYLGALYDAVAKDSQDPRGYSVFEYGYPIIEEYAVRPLILVDRNYFFGLKGIAVPDAHSPDAIVMDEVVEALANPGDSVYEMFLPIFGDISSMPCEFIRDGESKEQKESVRIQCDDVFYWNQHWVTGLSFSATKFKKIQEGKVVHRITIRIDDSSKENDYTVSEMYGDTMEYYKTNENWKYVYQRYPYQEQEYGAGMDIYRYVSSSDGSASIDVSLYIVCPDYDFDKFYSESSVSKEEIIDEKPNDAVNIPIPSPTREPRLENPENGSGEQKGGQVELPRSSVSTGMAVGAAGNSITATVTVENGKIIACRIDDEQATEQMREGYDFCTQALIGKECGYVSTTPAKTLTKDIREYMQERGYSLESGGYVHRSISNGIKAIKDALK